LTPVCVVKIPLSQRNVCEEATAEKFDKLLGEGLKGKNKETNVGKMLAKNSELRSRPYRSRTCDTLIKSQVDIFPVFRVFS